MDWVARTLSALGRTGGCGYYAASAPASEPSALAAIALCAHGRKEAAERKLRWLVERQNDDGSVGIDAENVSPGWPTGLAALAFAAFDRQFGSGDYAIHRRRAVAWLLSLEGERVEAAHVGHDGSLVGWPWVAGTHSWLEPTAWALLALKATGHATHPRAQEARRLLVDRLLPDGGANYGNTSTLGRTLRPHLEPSGLALLALAPERDSAGKTERTLEYLKREVRRPTGAASLAYGLLGLSAYEATAEGAEELLTQAAERAIQREALLSLALLALAALGPTCPLVRIVARNRS